MERLAQKKFSQHRRQVRSRAIIRGTAERPRMAVSISNLHVTAQIIDDTTGKTLVYASSTGKKMTGPLVIKAETIGAEIAAKAKKAGISKVAFDRAGHHYQGRIKALADKARSEGLDF